MLSIEKEVKPKNGLYFDKSVVVVVGIVVVEVGVTGVVVVEVAAVVAVVDGAVVDAAADA